MFCSYCGTETTHGLNYCKRCGSSLTAPAHTELQEARPALSTGMAWAAGVTMVLVVCVGLAAVFGTISDLAHFITPNAIIALAVCGSATILGSVFLLTRFWMRLLTSAMKREAAPRLADPRRAATSELGPARMSALPDTSPPPPLSSVTEHTTRTLTKG